MKSSVVVNILNSLSNLEKKWLLQFANSSFHNRNDEVTALVKTLLYSKNRINDSLDIKFLEQLYPNKKWTSQKAYDLIAFTTRLLEKFLVQLNFKQKEALQQKMLLQELKQKGLNETFKRTKSKVETARKKVQFANDEYYHQQFLISGEVDDFLIKNESRNAFESLQEKADHLDSFYLISKLKTFCEMLNRTNIVNVEYELRLKDEIEGYLKQHSDIFYSVPAIAVYFTIFKTLTAPDKEEHFFKLLDLIENYLLLFPKKEGKELYGYAQNYCIKKVNAGKSSYLSELFKLYQLQITNDYILDDNVITEWSYKNIITAGLRLEEFEWTENFIHTYKPMLQDNCRENAYNYNLANFYYEKDSLKQSIRLLQSVRFTDAFYNLSSRFLLIKIFYEQEESEALLDQVRALKAYLTRNKLISDNQKNGYKNLTKYTIKLNAIRETKPKKKTVSFLKKLDVLHSEIENHHQITNKKWLLEKVKEYRS